MPKMTSMLIHVAFERVTRLARAADYGGGLNPAQWQSLRYLARCNRFSDSQKHLGCYLASTKGTVSQTLASLVSKGLIRKTARPGGGLTLSLTPAGEEMLDSDPAAALVDQLDALSCRERKRLLRNLRAIMPDAPPGARPEAGFGTCGDCRHFSKRGKKGKKAFCARFGVALKKKETRRLCAHHAPREG